MAVQKRGEARLTTAPGSWAGGNKEVRKQDCGWDARVTTHCYIRCTESEMLEGHSHECQGSNWTSKSGAQQGVY